MRTAWIVGVVLIAAAAPTQAGPLADAIAAHGPHDVAALRAQLPGDASLRCALGTVYALRSDVPRAALYLVDCAEATLSEDIARDVLRQVREIKLERRELAELSIASRPGGMKVELEALAGEELITPVTVWVKPGLHTVTASSDGKTVRSTITAQAYTRGTIWLDAGAPSTTPAPRDKTVDFADENARETTQSGPPPDIKRPSIMSDKYRGIASATKGAEIEDPLATATAPAALAMWLGIRFGGGMFDDAAASAHLRPAFAAAARFELGGPVFVAARLDWTRRGGASVGSSIDTLGASAGIGSTVIDSALVAVALIGQLRTDLRFADTRDRMAVRRAGVGLAAGIELAVPATPLTAGVRFEQGLTELVTGARDRALLFELGVDWR